MYSANFNVEGIDFPPKPLAGHALLTEIQDFFYKTIMGVFTFWQPKIEPALSPGSKLWMVPNWLTT